MRGARPGLSRACLAKRARDGERASNQRGGQGGAPPRLPARTGPRLRCHDSSSACAPRGLCRRRRGARQGRGRGVEPGLACSPLAARRKICRGGPRCTAGAADRSADVPRPRPRSSGSGLFPPPPRRPRPPARRPNARVGGAADARQRPCRACCRRARHAGRGECAGGSGRARAPARGQPPRGEGRPRRASSADQPRRRGISSRRRRRAVGATRPRPSSRCDRPRLSRVSRRRRPLSPRGSRPE